MLSCREGELYAKGGGYDEKCKYGEGRLGTVVSFDGSVVYIAVLYKVCL
jgi:hypothetical protein